MSEIVPRVADYEPPKGTTCYHCDQRPACHADVVTPSTAPVNASWVQTCCGEVRCCPVLRAALPLPTDGEIARWERRAQQASGGASILAQEFLRVVDDLRRAPAEIARLMEQIEVLEQEKLDMEGELESTIAQIGAELGDAAIRETGSAAGTFGREPGFEGGGPPPVGVDDPGVKNENPPRAGYPSAVLDGQPRPSVKAVDQTKTEK